MKADAVGKTTATTTTTQFADIAPPDKSDSATDTVETDPDSPANDGLSGKDRGRCTKLAPGFAPEIKGGKWAGKIVCDEFTDKDTPEARKRGRTSSSPKPKPPKGTVSTNDDDIVVTYEPKTVDFPNGDEIVGKARDTAPVRRTEEEKRAGSRTRKMVERHMARSVERIHGQKPTGRTTFDSMKTTTPPMGPGGAVKFAYKYSFGLLDSLGNLSQHGKITQGQEKYARAYTDGFAHAYDGSGAPPEEWVQGKSEKEILAYRSGMGAWEQMERHEREEFRVGESVKHDKPLEAMTGTEVKDSMMESWRAGRMGLHRGRDE